MGSKAIENGLVISGAGDNPLESGVVLIEEDKIAAVGTPDKVSIPDGAERIDASGKTVMPGLMDAHMHVTSMPAFLSAHGHLDANLKAVSKLRQCLSWGTTTVANVSGCPESVILRKAIDARHVERCSRMMVGAMVNPTGGHVRGRTADGPWEVRKAVREMILAEVDFIKTSASGGFQWQHEKVSWEDYTTEELTALVEEAHSKDKLVAVHAHSQPGLNHSIEAGCDMITHGAMIDDEALAGIAAKDLYYIPTLYITSKKVFERPSMAAHTRERMSIAHPIHREGVRKAVEMGLKIGVGTDGGPGSVMDELNELVWCGMTPLNAIIAATRNTAEALGVLDKLGTLEPGKKADVLIVDGNPLQDISLMCQRKNIALVMKDGVVQIASEANKQYFHLLSGQ